MPLDNTLSDALPSGVRIGGFANFVTNTKPTGPATGDRWYKPNDGSNWYWSGSLWLSNESLLLGSDYKGVSISASSDIWGTPLTGRSLFTGQSGIYFVSALNTVYSGSLSDSSNHWQIQFTVHYSDQTFDSLASSTNQNVGASTWVKLKNSINSAKSTLTKTADFVYVTATKVGNPSPLFVKSGLEFKWVHP